VIKPISKEALEKRIGHLLGFANDTSWVRPVAAYQRVETRAPGGRLDHLIEPRREAAVETEEFQPGGARAGAPPASSRPRRGSSAKFTQADLAAGRSGAKFADSELAGDGASVFNRLSALRGKSQDSDLAGDIAAGVSHLAA
jgi:hypothetical protein